MRLYDFRDSGNGYKVRLLLAHLRLDYELVEIDILALYAYTHVADQGGFDLGSHPNAQAWCARVRSQPGHVPMVAGRPVRDGAIAGPPR
jgi:glutathione S-transferase